MQKSQYWPAGLLVVLAGLSCSSGTIVAYCFDKLSFPVLLFVVLFLLLEILRPNQTLKNYTKQPMAENLIIAASSFALLVLLIHPQMRVLTDESNLVSTSYSFFLSREARMIQNLVYENDLAHAFGAVIPDRPLLLPFLASILHSLRGFDVHNVFLVNAVAFFFLILSGLRLLDRVGLSRSGKIAAVLLISSHPILLQGFQSAALEPLFLALFVSAVYYAYLVVVDNNVMALRLFMLVVVLGVQTRYEAAFPLAFLCGVICYKRPKLLADFLKSNLCFGAILLLGLMPYIWQRILLSGELGTYFSTYAGHLKTELHGAFAWQYLLPNLRSLKIAAFSRDPAVDYSPLISLAALVLGVYFLLQKRTLAKSSAPLLWLFLVPILAHFLLILCFLSGEASDPGTARLYSLFFFGLSSLTVVLAARVVRGPWLLLASSFIFFYSLSSAQVEDYSRAGIYSRQLAFVQDYYREHHLDRRDLLITYKTTPYIATGLSALDPFIVSKNVSGIETLLKDGGLRSIFYLEDTSAPSLKPDFPSAGYQLAAKHLAAEGRALNLWEIKLKDAAATRLGL